jgi:hypothetical protein
VLPSRQNRVEGHLRIPDKRHRAKTFHPMSDIKDPAYPASQKQSIRKYQQWLFDCQALERSEFKYRSSYWRGLIPLFNNNSEKVLWEYPDISAAFPKDTTPC